MKNVIWLILFVCACNADTHVKMGDSGSCTSDAGSDIDSDAGSDSDSECKEMLGSSLEWTLLIKEGSSKKCYPNAIKAAFNNFAGSFDKLTSQKCMISAGKLDILCNIHYDIMCPGMIIVMDCDTNTTKCIAKVDIAVLYNADINGEFTTCNFEVSVK